MSAHTAHTFLMPRQCTYVEYRGLDKSPLMRTVKNGPPRVRRYILELAAVPLWISRLIQTCLKIHSPRDSSSSHGCCQLLSSAMSNTLCFCTGQELEVLCYIQSRCLLSDATSNPRLTNELFSLCAPLTMQPKLNCVTELTTLPPPLLALPFSLVLLYSKIIQTTQKIKLNVIPEIPEIKSARLSM